MKLISDNALEKMLATVDAHHAANVQLEKMAATIDTNPTVHAHWNKDADGRRCSNCKCLYWDKSVPATAYPYAYYCPHCGAKMDGG